MNILTCLDTATEGQVFLEGTDAAALDEEDGVVFAPRRLAWCSSNSISFPF